MNCVWSKVVFLACLLIGGFVCGIDQMSRRRALYYAGQGHNGDSPEKLHRAVLNGDKHLVGRLIAGGVSVNVVSEGDSSTPLHVAVVKGNAQMVTALLERGANVNAPDKNGYTPFDVARRRGNAEMMRMLRYALTRSKCVA